MDQGIIMIHKCLVCLLLGASVIFVCLFHIVFFSFPVVIVSLLWGLLFWEVYS